MNNKLEEIVDMMIDKNIEILGICETRLPGEGTKIIHNNFHLIFKGMISDRKYGVAFIVAPTFAEKIEEISYINERIIAITLKVNAERITFIQVYAPHQGRPEDEKVEFYSKLQNILDRCGNTSKIVMGDINAHVGRHRNNIENVIGAHGIGERNNEGERLIDFCVSNSMAVMNTFYQHRDSHKWSWYRWNSEVGDYVEKSMIDLFLTTNKKLFKDVKSIPSLSFDSDHRLVLAKLNIKKPKPMKKIVRERIKLEKLKEPEKARLYKEKITEVCPSEQQEIKDIEEEWIDMKDKITKIAKDILETKKISGGKKKKTVWWTNEVRDAVKKKTQAFRRWMRRRSLETRQEYEILRNEAERVKARAKRESWKKLGKELEEDMQGTRKLIYSIAKSYKRGEERVTNSVKNKDGVLLTDENEVDERWKEYFSELLNPQETEVVFENNITRLNYSLEISEQETKDAITKMKNGKSPGNDGISIELLRGNENVVKWLTRIFNVAWCEGRIPEDWGKAVICKVPKKGDKLECRNWRGISLLSHVEKMYERILEKRLRETVEEKLEEGQYGFRPERGTTDAIFSLKMLMEKRWEWDKPVYIAFIDLEKAFDRLPRRILWETLEDPRYDVDRLLIRAVKSLFSKCVSAVRTPIREDNWFEVNAGVRQGGVISPLLFILFMDRCMKDLNLGEGIITLAYADDIALVAEHPTELQNALNAWNIALKRANMKINTNKTEIMMVARQKEDIEICLEGKKLKLVEEFKYLGVKVDEKCHMETEIRYRIQCYSNNLGILHPLMREKLIPRQVKAIIYKTILRPVLTYGSETWTLTDRMKSKIQAAEMRVLRMIKGVTRCDRLRNEDIRKELEVESILEFVERSQLRWFGHVMRMHEDCHPAKYYKWQPQGKRPTGRPRKRWKDAVRQAIEARGKTIEEVERDQLYADRAGWRNFVRHHR